MVMNPDPSYVLDGLDGTFQPTVQLKIVEAGDLFMSWRWEHQLTTMRAFVIPWQSVHEALHELLHALPSPLEGESVEEALTRSLTHGPLTDLDREIELATKLAASLFPHPLAVELNSLLEQGVRSHIRLQPSPSTAQVPWESLRVDEGERVVHNTDVSVLTPATIRNTPQRRVSAWDPDGAIACALDPRVPGFDAASPMGSVLGLVADDSPLRDMVASWGDRAMLGPSDDADAFRRDDVTRDELHSMLAEASRFLYVGHVTTSEYSLDARLHLSCPATAPGRAAPVGAHRPLTAADIALGHDPQQLAAWRMPNRVALIACESGGETRFAEPAGLVAAAIHSGAQYVTATRWTLPTDHGIHRFVTDADQSARPLSDAIIAVDEAHEADRPVAVLNHWQREQADRWEATGLAVYSPVIWGSLATTYG